MRSELRVATLEEVVRFGSRGGHKALRARGLLPPVMGAAGLAIDGSTPLYVSTGTSAVAVSTLTSASFTPPLGALLAVSFSQDNGAVTVLQQQPSNTGGAVTWDAAVKVAQAGSNTVNSIWLGTVTTSASMTVTQTMGTAEIDWGFGVVVVTGQAAVQNGTFNSAASTSGTPTVTLASLVGSNSLILGAFCNFTNQTVGTPASGQSLTFNTHAFSNSDAAHSSSFWTQYLTGMNLAAGASAQVNDTAPTTVNYGVAALEILAAGVAASTPYPVFLPRNTLGRGVRNLEQMAAFRARVPKLLPVGPTVFTPVLTAAQDQAPTLQRQVIRALAPTQAQVATDVQALVRAFSVSQGQTVTSANGLGRALSVAQGQTPVAVLQGGQVLSTTQGQSGAIQRGLARIESASQGQTVAQALALSRALTLVQSQTSSLTFTKVKFVNLALTQGQTVSQVLQIGLPQPVSQGQSSSSAESTLRSFSTTQGQTVTSADQLGRSFSTSQGQSPSQVLRVGRVLNALGSYAQTVLADTPSAYWRLDETSGSIANDSSGNGINGTYHTGFVLGVGGAIANDADTAVSFSGATNAQVDGLSAAALALSTGTIETWVKTTTGGVDGIIVKQNAYGMYVNASGRIDAFDWTANVFANSGTATGNGTAGPLINDDRWHHVAMTFQSGVGLALFVDGVQVTGLAHPTVTVLNQTIDLQLASGHFTGQNLPGAIDEAAVYNYVLSAAQIANHHNLGTGQGQMQSASVVRTTARTASTTQGQTPNQALTVNRTLSGSQGQSASLTFIKVKLRTLTLSQGQTSSQILQVGRTSALSQGQTVTSADQLGRRLTTSQGQTPVSVLQGGQVLSTTQGQTGAMQRGVRRTESVSQGQTVSQTLALRRTVTLNQTQVIALVVTPSTAAGPPPMELPTRGSVYSVSTRATIFQLPTASALQQIVSLGALYGTKSAAGLMPYIALATIFQLPTKGSLYGTSTKASIMAITTSASVMGPNTKGVIKA